MPWAETSRDYIESREDIAVNNNAQYCSVVKTSIGKSRLILGGEVDARKLDFPPSIPKPTLPLAPVTQSTHHPQSGTPSPPLPLPPPSIGSSSKQPRPPLPTATSSNTSANSSSSGSNLSCSASPRSSWASAVRRGFYRVSRNWRRKRSRGW